MSLFIAISGSILGQITLKAVYTFKQLRCLTHSRRQHDVEEHVIWTFMSPTLYKLSNSYNWHRNLGVNTCTSFHIYAISNANENARSNAMDTV